MLDTCQSISSSRLISLGPAPALLSSQGVRVTAVAPVNGEGGGLCVGMCGNKEAVVEGKGERDRNQACSKKRLQLQRY